MQAPKTLTVPPVRKPVVLLLRSSETRGAKKAGEYDEYRRLPAKIAGFRCAIGTPLETCTPLATCFLLDTVIQPCPIDV